MTDISRWQETVEAMTEQIPDEKLAQMDHLMTRIDDYKTNYAKFTEMNEVVIADRAQREADRNGPGPVRIPPIIVDTPQGGRFVINPHHSQERRQFVALVPTDPALQHALKTPVPQLDQDGHKRWGGRVPLTLDSESITNEPAPWHPRMMKKSCIPDEPCARAWDPAYFVTKTKK